ncbi:MAG: PQQ-binding-like beta-propeller repeat protein [Planctomycetota bacterium]
MRTARFGIRAYLRPGPDYERLEEDRAARAEAGPGDEVDLASRAAAAPPPFWTDFWGPGRRGVYDERPILLDWPADGLRRLWRQPIGPGYGSFVVAEGLAFTLEQRRDEEAVVAYDPLTGREVWKHAYPARFEESMSGEGPRTTPIYSGGSVFSLGATGELLRLRAATGEVQWRRDVLLDSGAQALAYGFGSTPLVHGGTLIVCGAAPEPGGCAVLAYDLATGEPVWRALDEAMAYASPIVYTLAGREQAIVFTATRVVALDPADGRQLWEHPWAVQYGLACSQPVRIDDEHLFVSSGYGMGASLLRISAAGDELTAERVWKHSRMKNRYSGSILYEGHLYGLDEGRIACLEPLTGKRLWKGPSFGYGQLILSEGHFVVLSEEGELVLVEASPEEYREKARFEAIEGLTLNVPALADGLIFVRNHDEMACFDLRR